MPAGWPPGLLGSWLAGPERALAPPQVRRRSAALPDHKVEEIWGTRPTPSEPLQLALFGEYQTVFPGNIVLKFTNM